MGYWFEFADGTRKYLPGVDMRVGIHDTAKRDSAPLRICFCASCGQRAESRLMGEHKCDKCLTGK